MASTTFSSSNNLERLSIDYGSSVNIDDRTSRTWCIDVWRDGSARVRHYPLDESLPAGSVYADWVAGRCGEAEAMCLPVSVYRHGEPMDSCWLPLDIAEELFDHIIELVGEETDFAILHADHDAADFAAAHPPEVLDRHPVPSDAVPA